MTEPTKKDKRDALVKEHGELPPELFASLDLAADSDDEPPTNEGEFPDPREHQ
jgi:hypothetical protein